MFGIFGGKKKIAGEIAVAISNTIRACFAQTEYIDRNGAFHPPYNFWSDVYIAGFVHMLISLFIKFEFSGDSMTLEKKGDISLLSLTQICKNDWSQVWGIIQNNTPNESEDFKKGADDALPLFASITGRLKANSKDPLIEQAKLAAENRYKQNKNMAEILGHSVSTNSAIGMAVMELTIMQHVKDIYLLKSEN